MRLTVGVSGLREVQMQLRATFSDRRMSSAIATALTRVAGDVAAAERTEMTSVFDRPKPYTLGAVGIKPATATDLVAEVFLKQAGGDGRAAAKYLEPQIRGGTRQLQGFEVLLQKSGFMPPGWRIVPGVGAKLDAFGNVQRSQLAAIVASLRAQRPPVGPQPKRAMSKRIAAARRAGGAYFVIPPGRRGAHPGVYIREFTGRNITPILLFVRTVAYRARFDFVKVAHTVAQQRLGPQLQRAIDESVQRLAARGASR